jgi:hypothetical protein
VIVDSNAKMTISFADFNEAVVMARNFMAAKRETSRATKSINMMLSY